MREYMGLYRGKRVDNGEWVEGYYVRLFDGKGDVSHRIYSGYAETDCGEFYPDWFEVDPDTVGECALKDKNGKLVFEGDIIKVSWYAPRREPVYEYYEIVYNRSGFFTRKNGKIFGQVSNYIFPNVNMRCEIIGNIHDNPELLERG